MAPTPDAVPGWGQVMWSALLLGGALTFGQPPAAEPVPLPQLTPADSELLNVVVTVLAADGGQPRRYGIDPVQFYGELYLPQVGRGLDVKLGRHFCQFGVESIDPTQNALASHAYNFIYNPFTHTGLLTTLKLDDAWSV